MTVCGRHLNPIPPLNPLKVHVTNVQTFSNEVYIPCNRISTKKTLFNISNLSTKPNPLSQTLLPYWIILCHQDTESQSFTKKINPLPLPGLLYREGVYSGLFLTNIYHHMRTLQTFNHLPLVANEGQWDYKSAPAGWWMICVLLIIMQSHSHEYQANVLPLQGVRGVIDEVSPCTRQWRCVVVISNPHHP